MVLRKKVAGFSFSQGVPGEPRRLCMEIVLHCFSLLEEGHEEGAGGAIVATQIADRFKEFSRRRRCGRVLACIRLLFARPGSPALPAAGSRPHKVPAPRLRPLPVVAPFRGDGDRAEFRSRWIPLSKQVSAFQSTALLIRLACGARCQVIRQRSPRDSFQQRPVFVPQVWRSPRAKRPGRLWLIMAGGIGHPRIRRHGRTRKDGKDAGRRAPQEPSRSVGRDDTVTGSGWAGLLPKGGGGPRNTSRPPGDMSHAQMQFFFLPTARRILRRTAWPSRPANRATR